MITFGVFHIAVVYINPALNVGLQSEVLISISMERLLHD